MTKTELVAEMSKKTGLSKRKVEIFLGEITGIVVDQVNNGGKVQITGFGTFYLGKRAKRRGKSPQDGSWIEIPAMVIPAFRAGKRFKELVR